jgi:hypothetical protein
VNVSDQLSVSYVCLRAKQAHVMGFIGRILQDCRHPVLQGGYSVDRRACLALLLRAWEEVFLLDLGLSSFGGKRWGPVE